MIAPWQRDAARLEPVVFRRFLRARGWHEELSRDGKRWRYTRSIAAGQVEVDIPTETHFADYARRMAEAVEILAVIEQVTPIELVAGLQSGNVDTIHFRFEGEVFADGSISLDDALKLRLARKNLLLAAAHSAVEPQPHFARLARTEPTAFLATCREVPARVGSYVSSVLVPVSPAVGQLALEDPFSRRVTTLLARALIIAADALGRGDDDALLEHVSDGLSANFLSALAELAPPGGSRVPGSVLDIGFSWSPARAAPALPRTRIRFSDALFPPLAEAARVLRETEPIADHEFEGYVIRLQRTAEELERMDPPEAPALSELQIPSEPLASSASAGGQVIIATSIDDRPGTSKVHVTLPPTMYQQAIAAHAQGALVRVRGTLARHGRRFVLEELSGFTIHPEPE